MRVTWMRQGMRLARFGLFVLMLAFFVGCPASVPPVGDCNSECKDTEECVQGKFCLPKCTETQTRCLATCEDTKTNTAHCGACDNKCKDGESCKDGKCEAGTTTCADGETECGGSCVKTDTDAAHCGACDNKCKDGETCEAGACKTGGLSCSDSESECGGICIDTSSSDAHCGKCDNACGSDKSCKGGTCECSNGQSACGDKCVDTNNSDDHCGACDNKCNSPQYCDVGSCVCPSGQTACGDKCVNTKSSDDHCGACDTQCPSGTSCTDGACACPGGKKLCSGACVDTDTDTANCGSCGTTCQSGEECRAGTCKAKGCQSGETDCSGKCVDTQTDDQHCGACGTICKAGDACDAGTCKLSCQSPKVACNGACVNVQTDAANCGSCGNACGSGEACDAGSCMVGCNAPKLVCSGTCTDTDTDDKNCGACGTVCPSGETCANASCKTACASPKVPCNGTCVNTQTDAANCGSCSNACATGEACTAGTCAIVCTSPQVACSGVCVDTQSDIANCGTCGNACASGEACNSGTCGIPCAAPSKLCNGVCIDVTSNDKHCGNCGVTCQPNETCASGKCQGTWTTVHSGARSTAIDSMAANAKGVVYVAGRQNDANNNSTFFVDRISSAGVVTSLGRGRNAFVGFNARYTGTSSIKTTSFTDLKGWTTTGTKGLFSAGGDLNTTTGEFVAPAAGYYYFSARAEFAGVLTGSGYRYIQLVLSINGTTANKTGSSPHFGVPVFAVTMVTDGVYKLAKGDKVSLKVRANKDNDYSIKNTTGFSGVFLGSELAEGFQVSKGADLAIKSTSFQVLGAWDTLQAGTFINGTGFNKTTGVYTAPSDGDYYFSARFLFLNAHNGSAKTIKAQIATTTTGLGPRDGRFAQVTNTTSEVFPLHVGGILRLKKGAKVRLMVESDDGDYSISNVSGWTGYRLPTAAPGFNVSSQNGESFSGVGWKQMLFARKDQVGQYADANFSNSTFTAPSDGYYKFHTEVLFKDVNHFAFPGESRVMLAINGSTDTNQASSAMTFASMATNFRTHHTNAVFALSKGDKVTVWVNSERDSSYTVGPASHFSGYQIGVTDPLMEARAVATDANDNLYVAGYLKGRGELGDAFSDFGNSSGEGRTFIAHRKSDGTWQPTVLLAENAPREIHADGKGNLVLCGNYSGTWTYKTTGGAKSITTTNIDSYIAKLKIGSAEADWALALNIPSNDWQYTRCRPASGGGAYVIGRAKGGATLGTTKLAGDGSNFYGYLALTKDDGSDIAWAKECKGGGIETSAVAVDANDNVYVMGTFDKSATFGTETFTSTTKEMYVIAFDKTGKLLWKQQSAVASGNIDRGIQIDVGTNGVVYVAGEFDGSVAFGSTTLTSKGSRDVLRAALNSSGNWLWANSLGGAGDDWFGSICVDPNGSLYTGGVFKSTIISAGSTAIIKKQKNASYFDAFVTKNLP